jgi:phage terminase small subunit
MEARAAELELTPGDMGAPPAWMSDLAKAEWSRLCADAEYRQVLAPAMRGLLEHYSMLYARMVEDGKGERPMSASERQTFHSLCMQLGLSPASQAKVMGPAKAKPESPWDATKPTNTYKAG